MRTIWSTAVLVTGLSACAGGDAGQAGQAAAGQAGGGGPGQPAAEQAATAQAGGEGMQEGALPAAAGEARARLASSPRHGEWVKIGTGGADSVKAWVVYPERSDKAPVVLVVHEIFGLTNWVRSVADQLAAEGFIAIAPDLLTGKNVPEDSTGDPVSSVATAEIRTLERADVDRRLQAVAAYGMGLPAAQQSYGIVGFCWGGTTVFQYAVASPQLKAAVVYYGTSPASSELSAIRAPVLGLYGGDDARVGATVPPADSAMKALGKTYEPHMFEGAGHGFLRQQDGRDGANLRASREAWPLTVAWFKRYL